MRDAGAVYAGRPSVVLTLSLFKEASRGKLYEAGESPGLRFQGILLIQAGK